MSTNTTPVWNRQGDAIARTTLTNGDLTSTTIDLTGKHAADIFASAIRKAATAYGSNPLDFICRPQYSTTFRYPNNIWGGVGVLTTPSKTTLSSSPSVGDLSFTVTSATGFSAGVLIGISFGTTSYEVARIHKVSGSTIYVDAPLLVAHTSADNISTYADTWFRRVPGGQIVEVGFDYGNSSSGPDIEVACKYITYDSDLNA